MIVIGDSKSAVATACSRILLIIESARSKLGPTHFISIPLNSAAMQKAFLDFKEDVLRLEGKVDHDNGQLAQSSRRVEESVFQAPSLLHLTIGTLALMGELNLNFNLVHDQYTLTTGAGHFL